MYHTHRCSASCHVARGDTDRLKCWCVCVLFLSVAYAVLLPKPIKPVTWCLHWLSESRMLLMHRPWNRHTVLSGFNILFKITCCRISCNYITCSESISNCLKRTAYMQFLWYFNGAFVVSFRTWQPLGRSLSTFFEKFFDVRRRKRTSYMQGMTPGWDKSVPLTTQQRHPYHL